MGRSFACARRPGVVSVTLTRCSRGGVAALGRGTVPTVVAVVTVSAGFAVSADAFAGGGVLSWHADDATANPVARTNGITRIGHLQWMEMGRYFGDAGGDGKWTEGRVGGAEGQSWR